ncbi:hypothetical protein [Kutzneria kofuensis]|uniref:hypothetical protein n=1 Tax=Kutzneria kofuensis TaxID=103725 RepID=UPI0031E9245B
MSPCGRSRFLTVLALAAAALVPLSFTAPVAQAAPLLSGGLVDLGCATSHAHFRCLGKAIKSPNGPGPMTVTTPVGLAPTDIQSAYGVTGLLSGGRTVAIVDAMDAPTAEADLAVFRSKRGLSPCTTANGCFKKVNQNGATSPLPAGDYGWPRRSASTWMPSPRPAPTATSCWWRPTPPTPTR